MTPTDKPTQVGGLRYADRDPMDLDRTGDYYMRHVSAMTREGLHSKADIAAELAWRDWQIACLTDAYERAKATIAASQPPDAGEGREGGSDE